MMVGDLGWNIATNYLQWPLLTVIIVGSYTDPVRVLSDLTNYCFEAASKLYVNGRPL